MVSIDRPTRPFITSRISVAQNNTRLFYTIMYIIIMLLKLGGVKKDPAQPETIQRIARVPRGTTRVQHRYAVLHEIFERNINDETPQNCRGYVNNVYAPIPAAPDRQNM